MEELLYYILGLILKVFCYFTLIAGVIYLGWFLYIIVTNGGLKWYYYNRSQPWKGGYWAPLLPDYPPYNDYEWNPATCRFEHKRTGKPLFDWQKPVSGDTGYRKNSNTGYTLRRRPEWIDFLFETPASLMEKRRRKKEMDKLARKG
ncbi:MAG: hypothetical protein K2F91_00655 [Muribaculaceae bacterium]|nr:hypothetical protein [Muribaculaceae bacterium]